MEKITELENGNLVAHIEFCFARHGGRKKMVVGDQEREPENLDMTTLRMIARGRHWQKLIDSGQYRDASDIASVLNTDPAYVARTVRLAYLAPKIVQLFIHGQAPDGLSLARLTKRLPDLWSEQCRSFDVAP